MASSFRTSSGLPCGLGHKIGGNQQANSGVCQNSRMNIVNSDRKQRLPVGQNTSNSPLVVAAIHRRGLFIRRHFSLFRPCRRGQDGRTHEVCLQFLQNTAQVGFQGTYQMTCSISEQLGMLKRTYLCSRRVEGGSFQSQIIVTWGIRNLSRYP